MMWLGKSSNNGVALQIIYLRKFTASRDVTILDDLQDLCDVGITFGYSKTLDTHRAELQAVNCVGLSSRAME